MRASGDWLVAAAARNNAEWCHALCRAYGIVGRFGASFWASSVRRSFGRHYDLRMTPAAR